MTLADIATTTKKISNEGTVAVFIFTIEFEHINAHLLTRDVTLYFDVLREDESFISCQIFSVKVIGFFLSCVS